MDAWQSDPTESRAVTRERCNKCPPSIIGIQEDVRDTVVHGKNINKTTRRDPSAVSIGGVYDPCDSLGPRTGNGQLRSREIRDGRIIGRESRCVGILRTRRTRTDRGPLLRRRTRNAKRTGFIYYYYYYTVLEFLSVFNTASVSGEKKKKNIL